MDAAAATLDELRERAQGCRNCPLWADATQTVFGEGAPQARLMFVGEAPGDQEDRQGRPFVGPAGQLFDRALQEVERHGKPERSAFQFEGHEIQRLRIPRAIRVEGNLLDLNVCWTRLGNLFLLGIDRYFIQRAISCARGNGETPLDQTITRWRPCVT